MYGRVLPFVPDKALGFIVRLQKARVGRFLFFCFEEVIEENPNEGVFHICLTTHCGYDQEEVIPPQLNYRVSHIKHLWPKWWVIVG